MAQKGKKEPAEIWQNIAGTGIDVQVPAAKLGEWAEQARKEGIISMDLHSKVAQYLGETTGLPDEKLAEAAFAVEWRIVEMGGKGVKAPNDVPVTLQSAVSVEKDKVTVYSEEHWKTIAVPLELYYQALDAIVSGDSAARKKAWGNAWKWAKAELKMSNAEEAAEDYVNALFDHLEEQAGKIAEAGGKLAAAGVEVKIEKKGKVFKKPVAVFYSDGEAVASLDIALYHKAYQQVLGKGSVSKYLRDQVRDSLKEGGMGSLEATDKADLIAAWMEAKVAKDSALARGGGPAFASK